MQIIVIGCGNVGSKLARVLSDAGNDIVVVDSDPNSFKSLKSNFNGITVAGVPIDQDVLKQAGIESADALAAVTNNDNINVMVSQVAKEIFNVPKVIARIYNPLRGHVFHEFGLETVCPTEMTVNSIQEKILEADALIRHRIGQNMVYFRFEAINKNLEGKSADSILINENESLFGIIRNKSFGFIQNSLKLSEGDTLVIAAIER